MNSLPNELLHFIFSLLSKITDKRNFSSSLKIVNELTKEQILYHENIYMTQNFKNLFDYDLKIKKHSMENYLLELCYDKYYDLIPKKYLDFKNVTVIKILSTYGNVELFSICFNLKLNFNFDIYAIIGNNLDLLKWLRENNYKFHFWVCFRAAKYGHLDILKWFRENGCEWDGNTCSCAARNGHLDVLKWSRENGCEWDSDTCSSAAGNGHLDVLKWSRENGCEWNSNTCTYAAGNGHLDILKWARENGCNWNSNTCVRATLNGHLDVLKWAKENGCPE
jgi:hypothetical protein